MGVERVTLNDEGKIKYDAILANILYFEFHRVVKSISYSWSFRGRACWAAELILRKRKSFGNVKCKIFI